MKKYIIFYFALILQSSLLCAQTNVTSYDANTSNRLGAASTYYGIDSGIISTGNNNAFNGYVSGYSNTSGYYNVFNGTASGYSNTSGYQNVFNGGQSGRINTTGYRNTFTGYYSGYNNLNGTYNLFEGGYSGRENTSGSHNVFNGYASGYFNKTGGYNSYNGSHSGAYNTTGSYNVVSGYRSNYLNASGGYNTIYGSYAGYNSQGSRNVFIGYQAGYYSTGDNKLYIDNSSTSTPLIYGDFDTNQLGINTNKFPVGYALAVGGNISSEEVKVQLRNPDGTWPDYVFAKDYNLPTLKEVENHIKEKGHLENIPSIEEVAENGILLGEMNAKLLEKIEELTLYAIQQQKEILQLKTQQQELTDFTKRIIELEQIVKSLKH